MTDGFDKVCPACQHASLRQIQLTEKRVDPIKGTLLSIITNPEYDRMRQEVCRRLGQFVTKLRTTRTVLSADETEPPALVNAALDRVA
jgi:hypothetical protein